MENDPYGYRVAGWLLIIFLFPVVVPVLLVICITDRLTAREEKKYIGKQVIIDSPFHPPSKHKIVNMSIHSNEGFEYKKGKQYYATLDNGQKVSLGHDAVMAIKRKGETNGK